MLPVLSHLYERVDAQKFFDAIEAAKNEGRVEDIARGTFCTKSSKWFGSYVHTYSVDEYKSMETCLMDENHAGFALKKRDIVSVFKSSKCTLNPVLDYILRSA